MNETVFKITEFSLQSAAGSGFSEHQNTWAFIHFSDADSERWFEVIIFCNTLWYSSLIEESIHTKGVKHSLTLKRCRNFFLSCSSSSVALITISDWKTMRSLISSICADGKPCNNLQIPWTNSCLHFALLLEILLTMDDDIQDENIL